MSENDKEEVAGPKRQHDSASSAQTTVATKRLRTSGRASRLAAEVGDSFGPGGGSPTSTDTAVDDAGSGQGSIEQDHAAVGAELVDQVRAADVAASLAQVDEATQEQWEVRYTGLVTQPDAASGIGSAGQLARVHVVNFMCHENFEASFRPNMVLISGVNGSGKSAVLQAIQLCLGARARDTGRSMSAKTMIRGYKEGAPCPFNSATASVTIWNTGIEAFKPQTFGRQITVKKSFRISGSNTVELLDQDGRKVSKCTNKHLEQLLNHLGIEAKNKAVCMSQDTCRDFTATSGPSMKYNVFMDATHIAHTLVDLESAERKLETSNEVWRTAQAEHRVLRKELRAAQEKEAALQGVVLLQHLQAALDRATPWAAVSNAQAEAEQHRVKVEETLPRDIEKAGAAAEGVERCISDIEKEREPLAQQLEQLLPRLTAVTAEQKAATERHRLASRAVRTAKHALQRLQSAARTAADEAERFQAEVREQEANLESNTQVAHSKFDSDLCTAKEATSAAKAGNDEATQQLREAEAAHRAAGETLKQATAQHEAAKRAVDAHKAAIRSLTQRQGNPVTAFGGPGVLKILQLIERDVRRKRFHRPPLGPLGALLKLEDQEWALAVEVTCGKHFDNFLVHDAADLAALKAICREARVNTPTVIVMNFDLQSHDLASQQQAPPDVLTLLNVLRVQPGPQEHTLRNVLVDSMKAERSALVRGDGQAVLAFMRRSRGARLLIGAWNQDGDRAYNRGNTTTIMPNNRRMNPRLMEDVSGLLQREQSGLASAEAAVNAATTAKSAAQAGERTAKRASEAAKKAHRAAQVAYADSQATEAELVAAGPDLDGIGAPGDWQREVAERQQEALQRQQDVVECERRIESLSEEDQAEKDTCDRLTAESKELMATNESISAALEGSGKRLAEQQHTLARWAAKREALQADIAKAQKQLDEANSILDRDREAAMQVCSEEEGKQACSAVVQYWTGNAQLRLPKAVRRRTVSQAEKDVMDPRALHQEKELTQQRIMQCQTDVGVTLADIQAQVRQLARQEEQAREELTGVKRVVALEEQGLLLRRAKLETIRKDTERHLRHKFTEFCSRRDFKGSLRVDREAQTLELDVEPPATASQHGSRQPSRGAMKGLSGGERSFATLSFAMALQSVISTPFCCLDEFDVFMDSVSRVEGLRLLIENALELPDRQFILLSPQDTTALGTAMERVRKDGKLQIPDGFLQTIKMHPPRP